MPKGKTLLKQPMGQCILLVDDNNISRRITSGFLTKLNVSFSVVESGQDALDQITKNHYTLILISVMMSGLDGFETTKKIRQFKTTKNSIPIIGVTSDNITSLSDEMSNAGFDDFLTKPINMNKLDTVIKKHSKSVGNILQHIDAESYNFDISEFEKAYSNHSLRKDIIQTFIDEEKSDRSRIEKAFKSKVNDDIYNAMHYMKGSFAYLKATKILHLTQHILDLSKANKIKDVLLLEKAFLDYYDFLLNQLKQYILKF